MAHHVYQSKVFVLGGTNIGDANKFIDLFTRDLGLIRGVARSVRAERSKLRYSLQPYTLGNVSLVRGREVWRVTGAVEDYSAYHKFKGEREKLALLYNVTSLLKRLLQGEEKNEYLFDTLISFVEYLEVTSLVKEDLKAIEYLTVLRILYSLGYVKNREGVFDVHSYDPEHIEIIKENKEILLKEINNAIKESHL